MTTISAANYYALTSKSTDSSTTNGGASSIPSLPTLASVMASQESTTNANTSNGDQVDLSPAAQAYLSQQSTSSSSTNASTSSTNFLLSHTQQETIRSILSTYADAPYTQDTFDAIQNDLKTAGLSAAQLSAKDQLSQFNPLMTLLDALNGTSNSVLPSAADSQAKATNYMQSIISQWHSISTTADSAGSTPAAPTSNV